MSGGAHKQHNFVIDDPRKVEVITDRGEIEYRRQRRNILVPRRVRTAENRNAVADIVNRLDRASKPCFLDFQTRFVPRAKFDEIVTPEAIFQVLSSLRGYRDKSVATRAQIAENIYYGDRTTGPCRKLLCVLLQIERGKDLNLLMQQGMSDDCLPLLMGHKRVDGEFRLHCRRHGGAHRRIDEFRPFHREQFALWCRRLTPPFITWDPNSKHKHYVLEQGDPLPMIRDDGGTRGADGVMPDEGGFSEVTRVKMDPGGGLFANHGLHNPDRLYAMKKLKRHPKDDPLKHRMEFDMEVLASIYTNDRADTENALRFGDFRKHLIPLLASFEIRNPDSEESTYYLLFDWADGNLKDFWRANQAMVGDNTKLHWTAKQFSQLIGALECIHNDRDRLRSERTWSNLYGRHGDIKPSNFLFFRHPDGKQLLVIGDLGLGRLHRDISRSQQNPSDIPMTATYRAPEFDIEDGKLSPRSDIYSMACVFLEHITWFLLGVAAVEQFAIARLTKETRWGFESDIFFTVTPNRRMAVVKPQVKEWIALLRTQPGCCEYLHRMLELIETRMLESDPEKRISASELYRELKRLESCFRLSRSFYTKHYSEGT
ncbi:mitogen-activated protein kinase KSS1 [Podospora aff. communis PSN243]|uniref:Mitogen-activated protein kinase KSS1 n=1 Tax=Podospora aff. communis PSN243 TaxID=3040156 RepID=A0AAV9GGW6_9PEZI|nr:mitogen-activated protein kinase KSS1 [Podospora aff. communis PSN243]